MILYLPLLQSDNVRTPSPLGKGRVACRSFNAGRGEVSLSMRHPSTSLRATACALILIHCSLFLFAQDTTITTASGSLTFSSVKSYGMTVSYSSTVPSTSGFLFLRASQPLDEDFLNQNLAQSLPQKGSSVSYAKVFQSAAPVLFNVREVVENTEYYFALVPYRTNAGVTTFVSDSSIFAQVKSSAANSGNYYSGLDFSSPDILNDLKQLLQNHTLVDYANYRSAMVQNIFERDTTNQQKVVNCEYSNETKIYSGTFDFVALDYSREHLFPRSWMPTGGSTNALEGTDYHNLALANLGDVNTLRSNFPMGEVVQVTDSFLECKKGKDASQNTVFEPREAMKGNVARAMFYQMICYNGLGGSWALNDLPSYGNEQDVNVLLNWHFNDLPDAFEKAKHEYIAAIQGNRNPFIDYPDLANCIDFTEIVKSGTCPAVGIREQAVQQTISIFPNPATEKCFITMENPELLTRFLLCDVAGRVLLQQEISVNSSSTEISLAGIPSGFYLATFILKDGSRASRKLQVVSF